MLTKEQRKHLTSVIEQKLRELNIISQSNHYFLESDPTDYLMVRILYRINDLNNNPSKEHMFCVAMPIEDIAVIIEHVLRYAKMEKA